ncbi:MAG: 30S ribosomal protein S17 [Proteobacteria bacterium]|nr:30S ribosomal protein S17 [Pseudomonadota bacterium]
MAESKTDNQTVATSNPRTVTGKVVSNKMNKTITVLIERRVQHPVYAKIVRRSTKLHAHDEKNECNEGDVVTLVECRPISKNKHWMLKSIEERALKQA